MSNDLTAEINITRIKGNKRMYTTDLTAREVKLTILANNNKLVSLNCSPGKYKYLAIGFLYTNGILLDKKNIISIKTERNKVNIVLKNQLKPVEELTNLHLPMNIFNFAKYKRTKRTNSSKKIIVRLSNIYKLLTKMQEKAYLFNKTGGVHSCGMANKEGSLLLFCEDVSRYNTIDRILGEALFKNINVEDKTLLTSCRITSGILKKIINGGVMSIVSRSAVTDSAAKLANKIGITLIGFARDGRMNVYSCTNNIKD